MKIIERIHNTETGEITDTERDETAAETKARLDYAKEIEEQQAAAQIKAAEKAAVLAKLGLTTKEVEALLA